MFFDSREDWELNPDEKEAKKHRRNQYRSFQEKAFVKGTPTLPEKMPLMPIFLVLAVFFLIATVVRIDQNSTENISKPLIDKSAIWQKAIPEESLLIKQKIKALSGISWIYIIETECSSGITAFVVVSSNYYHRYEEGSIVSTLSFLDGIDTKKEIDKKKIEY